MNLHKLNTYQILQSVSLVYIALPAVLFILGWLRISISIPLILLTMMGIYLSLAKAWHYIPEPNSVSQLQHQPKWFAALTCLLVILVIVFMTICSGVGGFAVQDGDYFKHNAFFHDLIEYPWPLAYEQTGPDDAPRILNTYVGYYLPSAVVGKLFGSEYGYFFSFVWVCSGLLLSILWILQFVRGWALFFTILFLGFSGINYFGWEFVAKTSHFGVDYNYPIWMMFYSPAKLNGMFWALGSNHSAIANSPHHIFPSWICIMMLFHDSVRRESNDRSLFIASFLPFISAFISIGTLPFVLMTLFQGKLKNAITLQNLLVGPLLAAVAGLYLISNDAHFLRGWIWQFAEITPAIPVLLIFYLLEFGLYFLVMPKHKDFLTRKELFWLYGAISIMMIFPIYRIGRFMDFPIKALNPSWIIFQVCIMIVLSRVFTGLHSSFLDKIRGGLLVFLLGLGSIAAISNVTAALEGGLFKDWVQRYEIPINAYKTEESLQLFSGGQTFFWKYLAKPVVYDTSTSREKLIDKFGNTFRMDFIKCNERQGFNIIVNGSVQGCSVKLKINQDGFAEALDGFGGTWTYVDKEWKSNGEALTDKRANHADTITSDHAFVVKKVPLLEKIPKIRTVENSGNLVFNVDLVKSEEGQILIEGWAFVKGENFQKCKTNIILQSPDRTFRVSTDQVLRYDLVNHFKDRTIAYAGFSVVLPENKLPAGTYNIGVEEIQEEKNHREVSFSNQQLANKVSEISILQKLSELPSLGQFPSAIDILKDESDYLTLSGWAVPEQGDFTGYQIDLILRSSNDMLLSDTRFNLRPDVTAYFNNKYKLDSCGFSSKIEKASLPLGKYEIGIYLHKQGKRGTVKFLDQYSVR